MGIPKAFSQAQDAAWWLLEHTTGADAAVMMLHRAVTVSGTEWQMEIRANCGGTDSFYNVHVW